MYPRAGGGPQSVLASASCSGLGLGLVVVWSFVSRSALVVRGGFVCPHSWSFGFVCPFFWFVLHVDLGRTNGVFVPSLVPRLVLVALLGIKSKTSMSNIY